MSSFTPYEKILRIAISGKLWVFMDEEHHAYVSENLVTQDAFWINNLGEHAETMETLIATAEELGLPYSISDDRTCFHLENRADKSEPIHTMLIEIPDDIPDDEEMMN